MLFFLGITLLLITHCRSFSLFDLFDNDITSFRENEDSLPDMTPAMMHRISHMSDNENVKRSKGKLEEDAPITIKQGGSASNIELESSSSGNRNIFVRGIYTDAMCSFESAIFIQSEISNQCFCEEWDTTTGACEIWGYSYGVQVDSEILLHYNFFNSLNGCKESNSTQFLEDESWVEEDYSSQCEKLSGSNQHHYIKYWLANDVPINELPSSNKKKGIMTTSYDTNNCTGVNFRQSYRKSNYCWDISGWYTGEEGEGPNGIRYGSYVFTCGKRDNAVIGRWYMNTKCKGKSTSFRIYRDIKKKYCRGNSYIDMLDDGYESNDYYSGNGLEYTCM